MMQPYLIKLDRAYNPIYFSILDSRNTIMSEWNRINKMIHDFKPRKLWLFGQKKKLKIISELLQKLQKDFMEWNKLADDMITHPNLIVPESEESQVSFLHYTALLRDIRNRLIIT